MTQSAKDQSPKKEELQTDVVKTESELLNKQNKGNDLEFGVAHPGDDHEMRRRLK